MTDVMLLWDMPILFEKLFVEHKVKCQRIVSESIGTPFLPACKCLMIPTGFANTDYTNTGKGVERNGKQLGEFVSKGGNLIVFGPMVGEYNYPWLPFKLKYIQKQEETVAQKEGEHAAHCLIKDPEMSIEFDGYFTETDGDVLFRDEKGNPLMVSKKIGDGIIIATTIHEYPSGDFLKWMVETGKRNKI